MPALMVNIGDPIFIGDFFGALLALPISLFLVYWLSAVKNRKAVVAGGLIGVVLGFLIILGWAGTLIFDTPLPGANGGNVFFGSVLFCSALGLSGGILLDLLIARKSARDYRRQQVLHQQPAHE
jgi:hypothetical protein